MAAQQLASEGFKEVINLSGGIKAWHGVEAIGRETQGMDLFQNLDSAEEILITAYSLEEGLQDFYLDMMQKVESPYVIQLFRKLADIEDIHKDRIFDEYSRVTGKSDRMAFETKLRKDAIEGGMTTEEFVDRFKPDFEKADEVISLAMAIEAQALDLYTRAGRAAQDPENRKMLERISLEEKQHLEQLGSLLDNIMEGSHG